MDRLVIEGVSTYAMVALALAPLALAFLAMALAFRTRGPARTHRAPKQSKLEQRLARYKWTQFPGPAPAPKL